MSVDQASSAGAAGLPKGRWSEFTQLSRQIKQAGLLERRRGWYAARIAINLALLAAGWVAFAVLGESWWQLVTAAYLAVVFTQLAFVGHDAISTMTCSLSLSRGRAAAEPASVHGQLVDAA